MVNVCVYIVVIRIKSSQLMHCLLKLKSPLLTNFKGQKGDLERKPKQRVKTNRLRSPKTKGRGGIDYKSFEFIIGYFRIC